MENEHKSTGFQHFLKAAGFSLSGLKAAWHNEAAFRQEVVLMVTMLPLGVLLGRNVVERALLLSPCLIVIITELLNSALEAVVDRIGPEHHHLSGRAKDLGSAAVFVSLILVCLVWGLIIYDRFLV